jgi:pimeloyl-ACP methyl ester carboxylesterase
VLQRFHALRRERGTHARPFGVLGISLGGMMALDIASRAAPTEERQLQPQRRRIPGGNGALCCAVVINSSPGRALATPLTRLRPAALWAMLRCVWTKPDAREALMLPLVVNHAAQREGALSRWRALAAARPLPQRTFFAQLLGAALWRAPERVRVPLLVLSSRADALTHCSCSVTIAKHYGGALALHATAGHDLTTDDPGWVAQRVREWLDGGMHAGAAPHGV